MKTKNFVATDVGGTFTDLVQFCSDDSGRQVIKTAKSDTTPPSFEKGVLNVLDKAAIDISDIDLMSHGTTVVINALTERKGDKTALITTTGFRDVLEIGRGNRPDFFNLNFKKPEPFIPRAHRYEITERINHFGEIETAVDIAALDGIDDLLAPELCAVDAFLVDPDVEAPFTELVHDGEDLGLVFSGVAGENLLGHRSWGI